MERRRFPRYSVRRDVWLYREGEPLACCRAQDVSRGGMRIFAGPLALLKGTTLEVELRLPGGDTYRIPAAVVHSAGRSVGLMFREDSPLDAEGVQCLMEDGSGSAEQGRRAH